MPLFQQSPAFRLLRAFILELNETIKCKPLHECQYEHGEITERILDTIENKMRSWLREVTPLDQDTSRYGNVRFRDWFDLLVRESEPLMLDLLRMAQRAKGQHGGSPAQDADSGEAEIERWKVLELAGYFRESFGNRTRIDYGTGHEASFVAWMFCLARLEIIPQSNFMFLVARLFPAYLSLMRDVQKQYKLEPAGSHGVWGLDDYQFLPFLWGAAQLIGTECA